MSLKRNKKQTLAIRYALNPQGLLLLGTSKSINLRSRLFRRVERSQKLYAKKVTGGLVLPNLAARDDTAGERFRGERDTYA